ETARSRQAQAGRDAAHFPLTSLTPLRRLGLRGTPDDPAVETVPLELRQPPGGAAYLTEHRGGPRLHDDELADAQAGLRGQVVLGKERLAQTDPDEVLLNLGRDRLGAVRRIAHARVTLPLANGVGGPRR